MEPTNTSWLRQVFPVPLLVALPAPPALEWPDPQDVVNECARDLVKLGSGIAGASGALSPRALEILLTLEDALHDLDERAQLDRHDDLDHDPVVFPEVL